MPSFPSLLLSLLLVCAAQSVIEGRVGLSPMFSTSFSVQEDNHINDYKTNSFDMSTYVNPNDTYVPSAEVEQGTDISSGDFQKSKDNYFEGAITPIALFSFGFLSLVVFNCCLCCGVAKICSSTKALKKHTISCGEQCITLIFAAFIIICFMAAHILYLGYGDVSEGLDIMRVSVSAIGGGFDGMNTHATDMQIHSEMLVTLCTTYGCLDNAETLDEGVEYMQDDLGKIPDYTSDINGHIDNLETAVNLLMFVMYAFLMITLLVYIFTELCCKAKPCGAICIGNITFVIVAVIGMLLMAITSVTADYCYENPTINTLDMLKASKGQMFIVWYSSCHSGENPVHRYVNYTHVANEAIIDSLGSDTSPTANDIRDETTFITTLLGNFTKATHESCSPVQGGWLSLVNEGVCDSFFQGVRTIWICEVAACISLFFLMITGAIMGKNAQMKNKIYMEETDKSGGGGGGQRGKVELGHQQLDKEELGELAQEKYVEEEGGDVEELISSERHELPEY